MEKKFDVYTIEELFSMDPELLIEKASERFRLEIPPSLDSINDMKQAGLLLGKCSSEFSYLANMAMTAKIRKRKVKREGGTRQDVEDALSREEIFATYADIMKLAYNSVSRMITVKQQINDELKFTDGRWRGEHRY